MTDLDKTLTRISVIKSNESQRVAAPRALSMTTLELIDAVSSQWLTETDDPSSVDTLQREGTSSLANEREAEIHALRATLAEEYDEKVRILQADHEQELQGCHERHELELGTIRNELNAALCEASASARRYMLDAQEPLSELCTAIAESLLGTEVDTEQIDTIRASIAWAIEELSRDQSIDVYLNPGTLKVLSENSLPAESGQGQNIRWHARPEMAPEDWVASSPATAIRRVRLELLDRISTTVSNSLSKEVSSNDPYATARASDNSTDDELSEGSNPEARKRAPDADAVQRADVSSKESTKRTRNTSADE